MTDGLRQNSDPEQARHNLASLFSHVARLYTCGDSSSLSTADALQIAESILYVLGLDDADSVEASALLSRPDYQRLFEEKRHALAMRCDEAMVLWQHVVTVMPPIRNIALRDTLVSIGTFKSRYDTMFAAHVVSCDIDYQLSTPVSEDLKGIDYIEAWLEQASREAEYLARFDTESCVRMLEENCPDYQGLLVNLYDLVAPHESELMRKEQPIQ